MSNFGAPFAYRLVSHETSILWSLVLKAMLPKGRHGPTVSTGINTPQQYPLESHNTESNI